MQVKVIIGTIAFMLSMVILGLITLFEPARMDQFTEANVGRKVEQGASVYFNNCAECHGINGKVEECYNAAGEQVGCQGRALNERALLCGDPSPRMDQMLWTGTKEGFIHATINAGRAANGMPVWGEDYGGPLQYNDVENVTLFVLNYETEELCSVQPFVFPWPGLPANAEYPEPAPENYNVFIGMTMDNITLEDGQEVDFELPVTVPGDAARAEELYNITYACASCHGDPNGDPSSAAIGPWLGEIAEVGATRIDGYDTTQYMYESIMNPAQYIVEECPSGPCANAMNNNFGERMGESPQDLIDIMTWLLGDSLDTESIPYGE